MSPKIRRRTLLRSGAALGVSGLAGCTLFGGGTGETPTATATGTGTETASETGTPTERRPGEWPLRRYDAGNTAYNPDAVVDAAPTLGWRVRAGLTDATGVVVGRDRAVALLEDGIAAFDAGGEQWRYVEAPVDALPVIRDGTVFVTVASAPARVVALDAENGRRRWARELPVRSPTAPVVAGEYVFLGGKTGDGGALVALDSTSGDRQWTTDFENPVTDPPAAAETTVVAHDGDELRALDSRGGTEAWTATVGDQYRDAPVVGSGYVVVPVEIDDGIHGVVAYDATGAEQWRRMVDGWLLSPALAGERAVLATGRRVASLALGDGQVEWTAETDAPVSTAPVVTDGTVVVGEGGASRKLYGFDRETGDARWTTGLATIPDAASVAGNAVFVHDGTDVLAMWPGAPGSPAAAKTVSWVWSGEFTDADGFLERIRAAGLPEDVRLVVERLSFSRTPAQILDRRFGTDSDPSLLTVGADAMPRAIANDDLTALSELASERTLDELESQTFDAALAQARGPDGDLYGFPLGADVPTIQYRRDLVRQAGYDPGGWRTDPPSWRRFADIVADVQDETGTKYGFAFQASNYVGLACCTFHDFVSTWGGAYFGEYRNRFQPPGDRPFTLAEPAAVDSIRMVRSFVRGPDDPHGLDDVPKISPEEVLQWTEEPSREPFTRGETVALRNWPYSIRLNASPENLGDALGVMPLPNAGAADANTGARLGGTGASMSSRFLVVNPAAAHRDAIGDLLDTLVEPDIAATLAGMVGALPPRADLFDHANYRDSAGPLVPYLKPLKRAAEDASPIPFTPAWGQESSLIADSVHAAYAGEKAPRDAMQSLEARLRERDSR